jgi:hypothetical protein
MEQGQMRMAQEKSDSIYVVPELDLLGQEAVALGVVPASPSS